MKTQLDEKQQLMRKIKLLSSPDVQQLKVFIAGFEAGKAIQENTNNRDAQEIHNC